MITVTRKVHIGRGNAGRRRIVAEPNASDGTSTPGSHQGRIPRVSRLMALAIRFDRLIAEGQVTDQSELARLAHVTQPRMTQIMNLLHLAPDVQEELLFLPVVMEGRDTIHERMLRRVAAQVGWRKQRRVWVHLKHAG